MEVFAEAARSLRRNAGAVALYTVLGLGTNAIKRVGDAIVGSEVLPALNPYAQGCYEFGANLFLAAGLAVAAVLGFSRLGRELDRPLWKVAGDAEALKRFFLPWFVLILAIVTTARLLQRFAEGAPQSAWIPPLMFVFFVLFLFSVPVAACVMFFGHFDWREMPVSLAPLAHQFPLALAVLFVNFVAFIFMLSLPELVQIWPPLEDAPWFECLIDVPFALVDCYVFAAAWLICMLDRREMEKQNRSGDYDF